MVISAHTTQVLTTALCSSDAAREIIAAIAAGGGGGSGTVTSVSVVTANGVSGTVATATTTPAITLALGAITPTSVAASGAVTGSNLSGTNTGDQTIALTGDVTGSGTGTFAATLANTAVTPGSYTSTNLTVDAKGRITAAANGSGGGLTIGSTAVSGGTAGRVLFEATGPVVSDDAGLTYASGVLTVGSAGSGTISCPGAGSSSVQIGTGAAAGGGNSVAVGISAATDGTGGRAGGVAVGSSSYARDQGVSVGQYAGLNSTRDNAINIGYGAGSSTDPDIANNVMTIGWSGSPITNIFVAGDSTGTKLTLRGLSSTPTMRQLGIVSAGFTVSTDASYAGYLSLRVQDFNATAGGLEFLRGSSNGTTVDVILPIANIRNALNDAAAALSPPVPVGGVYRNGSLLMIRVS